VLVEREKEGSIDPGDAAFSATFRNESPEAARFNRHQAAHPALVLEVRDEQDRPVFISPPSAPDERDLRAETVGPGESVTIRYAGFLDRSLAPGTYRVRYFSPYPNLGGTSETPLASDWIPITVRQSQAFRPGVELPRWPPPYSRYPPWLIPLRLPIKVATFVARRMRLLVCSGVYEQEIDESRTETISNAPAGSEAWNGTYGWRARFLVRVEDSTCRANVTVRLRLVGTITAAQQTAWQTAIRNAWSDKFKTCVDAHACCVNGLTIRLTIQFVTSGEHQVVHVGATTTNMGNWGASDTVDIDHEAGHMLGALDEYFTVNGVDYGAGRQASGNIMNNPANDPVAHHYDLVLQTVRGLLATSACTVPVATVCG
jgi:hypothetical protein